jgi:hypothetical protein
MTKALSRDRASCLIRPALVAISMVAGLGILPQVANAVTRYKLQMTCPIDGKPFIATMMSSFYQRGMRLDSKPLGSLVAPYPYPVCPGNGFVMYQNDFTEGELRAIKAIVLTDEYRQLRSAHMDYYMVAYVKERMGANDYDLGNLYLRASWEAEGEKAQLAHQYQAFAIEKYDAFLKHEPSGSQEWWAASVLAAELYRLVGHFDVVETRLKSLPPAPNATLVQVIDQIRSHARNHNAIQEEFLVDPAGQEATIGSGALN